jgi:enoyl-CoA hydratase/carnithine racemase
VDRGHRQVLHEGALELALACDLRFVADSARISDWHLARLGSGLGGWGASTRLSKLVGVAQAAGLILTGKEIAGAEALRIGLAQRMVSSHELLDETLTAARTIAGMDRQGMRMTLVHLGRVQDLSREEQLRFADRLRRWMPTSRTLQASALTILAEDDDATTTRHRSRSF